jgi:hypothetical protein
VQDDLGLARPQFGKAPVALRDARRSFFLVLPNGSPEFFRGAQTCRQVAVLQRDAGIRVVQNRASQIGVVTGVHGGCRSNRGAKKNAGLLSDRRSKTWSFSAAADLPEPSFDHATNDQRLKRGRKHQPVKNNPTLQLI